jgi:hypothetical protein
MLAERLRGGDRRRLDLRHRGARVDAKSAVTTGVVTTIGTTSSWPTANEQQPSSLACTRIPALSRARTSSTST